MSSAIKLIVNADDFAIDPAVNRAIIAAHENGIITSTAILANGSAFDDAVDLLQRTPDLGVGLHLCLVDQKPVSEAETVKSLVGKQGRLHQSHINFIQRYAFGQIVFAEVYAELEAQIRKVVDSGLELTHLDSHQHLHLLPRIVPIVGELAKKYSITKIRIPHDDPAIKLPAGSVIRRLQSTALKSLAKRAKSSYAKYGLKTTDRFFGFAVGGCFGLDVWKKVIPKFSPGVTEIMVHPGENNVSLKNVTGWNYSWEEEFSALSAPELKSMLADRSISLINYRDFN
ncbi:MAG: ChbG/HpnK family deacetylase [bacterium]